MNEKSRATRVTNAVLERRIDEMNQSLEKHADLLNKIRDDISRLPADAGLLQQMDKNINQIIQTKSNEIESITKAIQDAEKETSKAIRHDPFLRRLIVVLLSILVLNFLGMSEQVIVQVHKFLSPIINLVN